MENQQPHHDVNTAHRPLSSTNDIDSSTSNDNLSAGNAACALCWAHEGRYGNAIRVTWCSISIRSVSLVRASEASPQQALPPFSSDIPSALTVDSQDILSALHGFSRGTSPGGSGLHAQHLLDA